MTNKKEKTLLTREDTMFHFIEPQEHHLYKSTINPFLGELQALQVLMGLKKEEDLDQTNFLLVRREIKDIKGGVLLVKKRISMLAPEVAEYLCTFCSELKEVWTGMIAFQMHEEITEQDFEKVCKILYRALYEDLIAFSIKEKAHYLCLTMPQIEYLTINLLGLWPYVFEVKPDSSSDGLFHGIFSVIGEKQAANLYLSKPDFQSLAAQNCIKIATNSKKMKPFFTL